MLKNINTENRHQVLEIIRSAIVCIDIILMELGDDLEKQIVVLENSVKVLVDDGYGEFRSKFLLQIDPSRAFIFQSQIEKIKNLPEADLELFADLVAAMQRFERKFICDLLELIENEPPETRIATEQLLHFIFSVTLLEFDGKNDNSPGSYGGYGYGGYGYGGYGYGGYGYGGYGYGGYGYGGYGYGGYGYGGYGYGGYGYGGYGGYGYGGYGYGGYGYGGYGYGDYGYYGSYAQKNRNDFEELWDNQEFLWLNQAFVKGVRNSEGLVWSFKDANNRFTPNEGREILGLTNISSGDHDQLLFRAVAHAAASNPAIYAKLTPK